MKLKNNLSSLRTESEQAVDIPILAFHQVGESSQTSHPSIYIDVKSFEARLKWMTGQGYRFISLSEAVEMISGLRSYEKKSAVITFDDGYEGVYTQAFDVLRKYGCQAAVFLIASTLQENQNTSFPVLNVSQIREMMACGIEMGVHSFHHVDLTKASDEQLRVEIFRAKEKIEQTLGVRAEHFCYPYGKNSERVERHIVEAGYRSACSTAFGRKHKNGELFKLKRISVPYGQNWLQFLYRLEIAGRRS